MIFIPKKIIICYTHTHTHWSRFLLFVFSTVILSCSKDSSFEKDKSIKTDQKITVPPNLILTSNQEQQFVEKMYALLNEDLSVRTGETYTVEELFTYISGGLGYQHSNIKGLSREIFAFRDTFNIAKPTGEYTELDAANIYNTVKNKIKLNALSIVSDSVYYVGSSLRVINNLSPLNYVVELNTILSNDISRGVKSAIYMPENRYFEYYGKCDDPSDDAVLGAAGYLSKWLIKEYGYVGLSSNQYISDIIILTNSYHPDDNFWSGNYFVSQYFRQHLLADNPSDIIQDGHQDRVSYAHYWDKIDVNDMNDGRCVTPSDLSYYAPNVKSIIDNWLGYMGRSVFLYPKVGGMYRHEHPTDPIYGTPTHFLSTWDFQIEMGNLKTTDGPTNPPKVDIRE